MGKKKQNRIIKWFINNPKKVYWGLFGMVLIGMVFVQYFGLVYYRYPVPPGDDPMNHYLMTKGFYDGATDFVGSWKNGGYPPLYHLAMAKLAHLFGTDPMQVILWTYPLWIVLAGLSVFVFAYVGFGAWPALVSFFVYGFLAKTPLKLLNDGGYPNLVGASVFLPLVLAGLIWFLKEKAVKRWWGLVWAVVCAALLVLTHHISTFELLAVVLVFLFFGLAFLWKLNKWSWKKGLVVYAVFLGLLSYGYWAFFHLSAFVPARGLFGIMFAFKEKFPYFESLGVSSAGTAAMWSLRLYPVELGYLVFVMGLVGLGYGLWLVWRRDRKRGLAGLLLAVWVLVLFVGSRLDSLSNPERLGRDLAVPLSVASGMVIYYLFGVLRKDKRWVILFCVILVILGLRTFGGRVVKSFRYEPMIRMTQADLGVVRYLEGRSNKLGRPVNVITNNYNFYYPYFSEKINVSYFWYTGYDLEVVIPGRDYVIDIKSQAGWLPEDVKFDIVGDKDIGLRSELIKKSPTKMIELLKVGE